MANPENLDFTLPEGVDKGDLVMEYQIPGKAAEKFDDLAVDMAKIRPGMMNAILVGEQIRSESDD